MRRFQQPLLVIVFALSISLASPCAVRAQGNLRLELAEVAKGVKSFLDGRGEGTIAIGQFTAPARLNSSAGPLIQKTLKEELEKLDISVKKLGKLSLDGRFRDAKDVKTQRLIAQLTWQIRDRNDDLLLEAERAIFGDTTLLTLFGETVELQASASDAERNKKVEEALDKPKVHIAGTRTATSAASPYAVEVRVRKADSQEPALARASRVEEGLAFVPIQRGEAYEIALFNDSDFDAAVTLAIDGLSMYAFSDVKSAGKPRFTHVIVPKKAASVIKGWYRDNKFSEEFLVTEYSKSAAAELSNNANIGTITATFAAAWVDGEPSPPDDLPARAADGTGRGARVAAEYVEVNRIIGAIRATISVRYTRE